MSGACARNVGVTDRLAWVWSAPPCAARDAVPSSSQALNLVLYQATRRHTTVCQQLECAVSVTTPVKRESPTQRPREKTESPQPRSQTRPRADAVRPGASARQRLEQVRGQVMSPGKARRPRAHTPTSAKRGAGRFCAAPNTAGGSHGKRVATGEGLSSALGRPCSLVHDAYFNPSRACARQVSLMIVGRKGCVAA